MESGAAGSGNPTSESRRDGCGATSRTPLVPRVPSWSASTTVASRLAGSVAAAGQGAPKRLAALNVDRALMVRCQKRAGDANADTAVPIVIVWLRSSERL